MKQWHSKDKIFIRQQRTVTLLRWKTRRVIPTIAPVYCLEKVFRLWFKKGNTGRAQEYTSLRM